MQNAPAPLAQRMMSRQAPYGPVGMVSQNMSGNKKGGGSSAQTLLGLNFNAANITTGLTLSNNNSTVTNSTASTYTSAVGNAATNVGDTSVYWEFIWGTGSDGWCGFAISTFNANHANAVGNTVGQAANTCAIRNSSAQWAAAGASISSGTTFAAGDVLGLWLKMTASTINVDYYKNGTLVTTRNFSAYLTLGNTVSYVPAWSSWAGGAGPTLSNYLYTAPTGATVLTSPNTSALVTASASVPAVADGKYDVYTFNASGTFTVASTGAVRALVIAGGGGGGEYCAGGAGGYLENGSVVIPQTYTVTVGAGAGGYTRGNASTFNAISTVGGGSQNLTGGSGGGGNPITPGGANTQPGLAGTAGQGFAGGSGSTDGTDAGGGAGGGAGGVGGNGIGAGLGGTGGIGAFSTITGTSIGRAGGGGGYGTQMVGSATSGGGGGLANGTANTGGGGGGANRTGGSGVVIIRVRARA